MKRLVFILAFFVYTFSVSAQTPGGIGQDLRWWLKTDNPLYKDNFTTLALDGDLIQRWVDESSSANDALQTVSGNKPVFRTDIINGHSVVRFNGSQFLDAIAPAGVDAGDGFQMFIVLRPSDYRDGNTAFDDGTYILDRTTNTNSRISVKVAYTNRYYLQKRNDDGSGLGGPPSNTPVSTSGFAIVDFYRNRGVEYGIHINGKLDITSGDDNGDLTAPTFRLGNHAIPSADGLKGDVAEVILYSASLNGPWRQQVETYLALKYGITIDQTVPTDYIGSSGLVVYPATTTHDLFDHDIAGICLDDGSKLFQGSSQSQNPLSLLKIAAEGTLPSESYLVWGHNSPTVWNSDNVPSGLSNRMTRVWRAAETGETGSLTVSFDLRELDIDMSDPSMFALLVDSDGDFADATTNITGRTIVGSVVTFTGVNFNHGDYFTLASNYIHGPGGVAGARSWLRADKKVFADNGVTSATNGQPVQLWQNQGSATYDVLQNVAIHQPTFVTGIFNSNPVVRFDPSVTTRWMDFGPLGFYSTANMHYAIVAQPRELNPGVIDNDDGSYLIDRSAASISSQPLNSLKILSDTTFGFQKRDDAGGKIGGVSTTSRINTEAPQIVDYFRDYGKVYGILYNGLPENTINDLDGQLTPPNLRIGAGRNGANGYNGDIGEFIFFDRHLSDVERNRLDSYLAIKYGITLTQQAGTDYTAADGTIVYPASTTHISYRYDIAGIGQDNISRLYQTNSRSVNANSVVRMRVPSDLQNEEFLIWGSNNGSLITPNSDDVDGVIIKRRLTREWMTAETGETGTQEVSFDLSPVPGPKNESDLRMLIDRDGDGFADNDIAPIAGTLSGNIFTVTDIDFQHGDRFTVGTINPPGTPLPVQLVNFQVAYENPVAVISWRTESETNNDYFVIERSADLVTFETVGIVDGAGTSAESHEYNLIDPAPYFGRSYYRLKQIDFDGTFAYGGVRTLLIEDGHHAVAVFNNPNDGKVLRFTAGGKPFNLTDINIIGQQGALVQSLRVNAVGNREYVHTLENPLAAGFYVLRVVVNGKTEHLKLVVK